MKNVGGQAVLEGVMMRGATCIATSVRTPDGSIETLEEPIESQGSSWRQLPILRGVVNLWDSLKTGVRVMNYAASFFEEPDEAPSLGRKFLDRLSNGRGEKLSQVLTFGVSMVLALGLFTVGPTLLAQVLLRNTGSRLSFNLLEAGLKVLLFLLYLWGISRIPEIKRVFQYHGAEHKTIDAYERDLELTVDNVRRCSRYHARCGTNFMFLVLVVSAVVFSFVGTTNGLERIFFKILLIPLVAGLTYELIRWLGASSSKLSWALSAPGKFLQRLTTAEPEDSMIEVAIRALKQSEGLPYTVKDLKRLGDQALKGTEGAALDRDLLLCFVTGLPRETLLAYPERVVSLEQLNHYQKVLKMRQERRPISQITGHKEFMGHDFLVNESTLIPRPETELLVEEVLGALQSQPFGEEGPHILDLCTGSGAIGLSLAKALPEAKVTLTDLSESALALARQNALRLGVSLQTQWIHADLFDGLATPWNFDLIVSNPPYIPTRDWKNLSKDVRDYEPRSALDAGETGLFFYERIADKARQHLRNGGLLFLEIGADQGVSVPALLRSYDWQNVEVLADLSGRPRIVRALWRRTL
ncbi:Protein-N(5)-glutamine methyltransferase PrmC [Clostridiaceae bacterium JG1575]|nr:Protein-N(5)-glutamine methyltransferase PrmC [Clostridiaceae bacterium JG1575]